MNKVKLNCEKLLKIAFLTPINMNSSIRSKAYKAFYFFDMNIRFMQERYLKNFILCDQ